MDDIRIRGQQPQRRRDLTRLQSVRRQTLQNNSAAQYRRTRQAQGVPTMRRRPLPHSYYRVGYRTRRAIGQLAVIHAQQNAYQKQLFTFGHIYKNKSRAQRPFKQRLMRTSFASMALLVLIVQLISVFTPQLAKKAYALGTGESLLPKASPLLAKKITHNQQEGVYKFNDGFVPDPDESVRNGGPQISATLYDDPLKGIMVTDAVNNIDFGLKPKFKLLTPQQKDNRLIYPLSDGTGWLVYTLQAAQAKEDILLQHANGDKMVADYELSLGDSLEARLHKNGDIGVYGSDSPVSGNVATGSAQDAELLQKARQKAVKNKLLFTLPAPFVKEHNQTKSNVKAHYELKDGNQLKVVVTGLKKAHYPLTIDPSVYVESAAKFMRGNNDSNIDFDTSNELIQKGVLTGARIPSWSSTTALPAARWGHGTIVAGGYIYVIGGNDGTNTVDTVYWAKIDTNNYTIVAANPGTGNCSTWCNNSLYNLPATRTGASIATYNGNLYVIGGSGSGCSGSATICNTVYYSKIGANGEPNTWVTNANTLGTNERKNASVVAYNNFIYLSGGQTNASQNGIDRIDYAAINPDGSTGTWSNSITQMPGTTNTDDRWGHSMLQYNGYMYIIGGNQGGTMESKVWYIKINSDGTLASSWVQTTSFTTARQSFGGNFAQIWGGYLYITGGCSNITGQNCSSFLSDLQLASINADGTISDWTTITGVTLTAANAGHGFVAWRNTLYAIGGCTAMSSGNCTTVVTTTQYGHVNNDGDVSPKQTETNLPAIGNGTTQVGHTAQGVVVDDGYIYNIGGCAANNCQTMSDNAASAPINADGTLGSWTVDSTGTLNGTTGLGAFGSTVYNNTVYAVGGTSGAANGWSRSVNRATLTTGTLSSWTEQTNILPDVDSSGNVNGYGYQYVFARAATATTGNLYIVSGCWDSAAGVGCATYQTEVYKCTITNSTGAVSGCTTTGQLQIQDLDAATGGTQGLGLAAGAVWGDYIYLTGGACGSGTTSGQETASCDGASSSGAGNTGQLNKVFVAKLDASGDIVHASVGGSSSNVWQIATNSIQTPRKHHVSFTVNGYLYVAGGHDGTGGGAGTLLSDVQFAKIDSTSGDITPFTAVSQSGSTNNIITARWGLGYVAANGYLYFIGGCTAGAPPGSCTTMPDASSESLQVYNNYSGSPKSFTNATNWNTNRIGGGSVVLNGYIYYAGGCTIIDCSAVAPANYYAPINSDGSLGTWTTAANALPAARAWGKLVAVGGTLYYMGGQNSAGTAQSQVYYSTPSSGAPAAWGTATRGIGDPGTGSAVTRTGLAAAVYNDRIYVTGGSTGGTAQSTVYVSPAQTSGGNITGSWTSTTAFTTARSGHMAVAYGATLYILGGYDGTNYLSDVQYAPINSDGSIGSWKYGANLPQNVREGEGFAANGYMYIMGGRSAASTCTTNTYITPIIGYTPGSSDRYGIGAWSQTNVEFTGARYGAAVSYNEGKAYVLGGGCAALISSGTPDPRVYYTTLQMQPQIARFSLAIDADVDVFPSNWLMNGIDNGTGARWLFSYRSATSGASSPCANMTAWGSLTSFGPVTLGRPGVYTPKDGSGNNTSCARYFYLIATIDASQSFGYPEDVSRGPTVSDISFQFFSSPARRLLHGKAFNGGIQQPLDTPCRQSGGANNADCVLP
jgi:N-acetylneuraminic acid mutarotase